MIIYHQLRASTAAEAIRRRKIIVAKLGRDKPVTFESSRLNCNRRLPENFNFFENSVSSFPEKEMTPKG
jgi:hypothetical protein